MYFCPPFHHPTLCRPPFPHPTLCNAQEVTPSDGVTSCALLPPGGRKFAPTSNSAEFDVGAIHKSPSITLWAPCPHPQTLGPMPHPISETHPMTHLTTPIPLAHPTEGRVRLLGEHAGRRQSPSGAGRGAAIVRRARRLPAFSPIFRRSPVPGLLRSGVWRFRRLL